MNNLSNVKNFIGVDISKDTLDILYFLLLATSLP